ncbi:MAG: tyrosine-type recombinase/integrase, partial [Lachnospiraceae bacterium]|nr:tyrosine-type recombinase/integrase [Lachnospiraceae bacterium]
MTRQGFWKNLRKYGKEAGLEQEVTPHMLRHSFAVYALKKGADIHVLQSIMGHSDIASTNEYNALL